MKIRIICEPDFLYGRGYRPQVQRGVWIFKFWINVERVAINYETEDEAKAIAEHYAKGTWVSDAADF